MNPGLLNKRITILSKLISDTVSWNEFTKVWAQKIIKTKRRDDEQNEESYWFIIRQKSGLEPYMRLICAGESFDILTVEPYEKERGYLLLRCQKFLSLNDTCIVTRSIEDDTNPVETEFIDQEVYTDMPCQLIKGSGNANQTTNENEVTNNLTLYTDIDVNVKIGDKLTINHMQDLYFGYVVEYFRFHTFQSISMRLEVEA